MKLDYRIRTPVIHSLTSTPGTFTQARPSDAVLIVADQPACISTWGTASPDNDFLILANTYFTLHLEEGDVLSYVLATGGSNGTIRITPVD